MRNDGTPKMALAEALQKNLKRVKRCETTAKKPKETQRLTATTFLERSENAAQSERRLRLLPGAFVLSFSLEETK
jgi:hypothetical protein